MLKRIGAGALALALACAPARAGQSNLYSPTTGAYSGLSLVLNYNAALAALASSNSGAAAPANTQGGAPLAGQWWLNTGASPPTLRLYDGASWLSLGAVDAASHLWEPVIGGGAGSIGAGATVDLGSLPYSFLTVTGTATIASFGSSAPVGSVRFLRFASAGSTLAASASLALAGGADIVTAAGDQAIAIQTASGVWSVYYAPASGAPVAGGVPAGAVMAFNLAACPVGWSPANGSGGTANMLGTVARGYDPGATRDPAGASQSIGSYEADTLQNHTHSVATTIMVAGGGFALGTASPVSTWGALSPAATSGMVTGNSGTETRAKSTILLYCEKL